MPQPSDRTPPDRTTVLRRRNALWLTLRRAEQGSAEFEAALAQLSGLIGWDRERVLAGLGLDHGDVDDRSGQHDDPPP